MFPQYISCYSIDRLGNKCSFHFGSGGILLSCVFLLFWWLYSNVGFCHRICILSYCCFYMVSICMWVDPLHWLNLWLLVPLSFWIFWILFGLFSGWLGSSSSYLVGVGVVWQCSSYQDLKGWSLWYIWFFDPQNVFWVWVVGLLIIPVFYSLLVPDVFRVFPVSQLVDDHFSFHDKMSFFCAYSFGSH